MFCSQCQVFWQDVSSKAGIPQIVTSYEDITWKQHETILHHKIRDLKGASDMRCRICRIIYHTPTEYEHESLLKDIDEQLDVVLYFETSKGKYPVVSVEFREPSGAIRISKRTVASCSGLLTDGESFQGSPGVANLFVSSSGRRHSETLCRVRQR